MKIIYHSQSGTFSYIYKSYELLTRQTDTQKMYPKIKYTNNVNVNFLLVLISKIDFREKNQDGYNYSFPNGIIHPQIDSTIIYT